MAIIAFAAHHQPPGNANVLVGQCYRGEFGRLARDKLAQPWQSRSGAAFDALDHRHRPHDQNLAQRLIAGPRDGAKPLLAGGGMIFRRQGYPRK